MSIRHEGNVGGRDMFCYKSSVKWADFLSAFSEARLECFFFASLTFLLNQQNELRSNIVPNYPISVSACEYDSASHSILLSVSLRGCLVIVSQSGNPVGKSAFVYPKPWSLSSMLYQV